MQIKTTQLADDVWEMANGVRTYHICYHPQILGRAKWVAFDANWKYCAFDPLSLRNAMDHVKAELLKNPERPES